MIGSPRPKLPEEDDMLWTIVVILLVLWLLGLVSSYTLGGFIHLLLVVAVIVVIINLIQGRRPLWLRSPVKQKTGWWAGACVRTFSLFFLPELKQSALHLAARVVQEVCPLFQERRHLGDRKRPAEIVPLCLLAPLGLQPGQL